MSKKKYLSFYKKYAAKGIMPKYGLCESFKNYDYGLNYGCGRDENIELFEPSPSDSRGISTAYWGAVDIYTPDLPFERKTKEFTPLRQNVVLFCAAMTGELKTKRRAKR